MFPSSVEGKYWLVWDTLLLELCLLGLELAIKHLHIKSGIWSNVKNLENIKAKEKGREREKELFSYFLN